MRERELGWVDGMGVRVRGEEDASVSLGPKSERSGSKQTTGRIRWLLWMSAIVCVTMNACACKLKMTFVE